MQIEIEKLSKSYDGRAKAIDGLSVRINPGITALVGENGAGKSTLLRLIAGVIDPDEGKVILGDCPSKEKKTSVFFLPDDPFGPVGSTIRSMRRLYDNFYLFDESAFNSCIAHFSLPLDKRLTSFSKGMRRQLFAALALACHPRYLLLDEAFDGLDPLARLELKRGLIEMEDCTVIISSHSLRELEDICNSFALLDGGAIADAGDIRETLGTVHKFQIALPREIVREDIPFECLSFEAEGRVARLIARGDREELIGRLAALGPLFIDEIAVDFEELFLCEVQKRGYVS